ncbi:nickel ABC-transporter, permease protein [Escherichia coli]|uniref:Nickel ABC-transporter, permease protein n=1 Tax=Escherichia coli TaxID=562 RepID=A0A2X3J8V2_ECOLX|nr:nickel ABC-transporter, permease protein [Escherichia coli]
MITAVGMPHRRTDWRDDDYRKHLCLAGRRALCGVGDFNRDYPVIQCFTLMMVVVFVVCNLIVDLLNAALDPRIRRHEGAHA